MGGRRRARIAAAGPRTRDDLRKLDQPGPLLYTAQDVARFCEVDLKTIHHWADAGKIPHHRTEGRHLRFRHNHVVRFLRAHGYPLHDELTGARPIVHYAAPTSHDDEVVTKLSARFFVQRYTDGAVALAHLVSGVPDAIVLASGDPTFGGAAAIAALRARPETGAPLFILVAPPDDEAAHASGADWVVAESELGRLASELAKLLGLAL
jgi:excisionase family DNA binding protein